MRKELNSALLTILRTRPSACADLFGSDQYPDIHGFVCFYPFLDGTLAAVEAAGLPDDGQACKQHIFGCHIHEGTDCRGAGFSDTGNHYNPGGCSHPDHAGDLPLLFGNNGYALILFYTDRFEPEDIIGHTVVIHSQADDFRSQPSGDSGEKIACGIIRNTMP